jgi:hypothetical protein
MGAGLGVVNSPFGQEVGVVASERLALGLGSIQMLADEETRSISAENPTGERGGGAREVPGADNAASMMGTGWKVRPCIDIASGECVTLAAIQGPGEVRHIWITSPEEAYRDVLLRIYWDGEETPSVEVPLGDFFCLGHGRRARIVSLPVNVNPAGGMNCYWPMPFARSARITVENQRHQPISGFFYQVDYALLPAIAEQSAYFHAQWRREDPVPFHKEYTILDGVRGRGQFVGVYLAWEQLSDGWWGEGEVKMYVDGDGEYPTYCFTGTEDYFGGAWGFGGETYSAPFLGYPMFDKEAGQVIRHGLYRWHIMDPVRFRSDLKVDIQPLGWNERGKLWPLQDDIASVAYWYQTEPHAPFPKMLPVERRWPI